MVFSDFTFPPSQALQLLGLIVLAILVVLGFTILSPEARLRRRRRKSHSRLVSKSHRPTVRFSVRPPKK